MGSSFQNLTHKHQCQNNGSSLEIHVHHTVVRSKMKWKEVAKQQSEYTKYPSHPCSYPYKDKHIEIPCSNRTVCPFKEHPGSVENNWNRKTNLNPIPIFYRQYIIQRIVGYHFRHRNQKDGKCKSKRNPKFLQQAFIILVFFGIVHLQRHQIHATIRTRSRVIRNYFGMHRTGEFRARNG